MIGRVLGHAPDVDDVRLCEGDMTRCEVWVVIRGDPHLSKLLQIALKRWLGPR